MSNGKAFEALEPLPLPSALVPGLACHSDFCLAARRCDLPERRSPSRSGGFLRSRRKADTAGTSEIKWCDLSYARQLLVLYGTKEVKARSHAAQLLLLPDVTRRRRRWRASRPPLALDLPSAQPSEANSWERP